MTCSPAIMNRRRPCSRGSGARSRSVRIGLDYMSCLVTELLSCWVAWYRRATQQPSNPATQQPSYHHGPTLATRARRETPSLPLRPRRHAHRYQRPPRPMLARGVRAFRQAVRVRRHPPPARQRGRSARARSVERERDAQVRRGAEEIPLTALQRRLHAAGETVRRGEGNSRKTPREGDPHRARVVVERRRGRVLYAASRRREVTCRIDVEERRGERETAARNLLGGL